MSPGTVSVVTYGGPVSEVCRLVVYDGVDVEAAGAAAGTFECDVAVSCPETELWMVIAGGELAFAGGCRWSLRYGWLAVSWLGDEAMPSVCACAFCGMVNLGIPDPECHVTECCTVVIGSAWCSSVYEFVVVIITDVVCVVSLCRTVEECGDGISVVSPWVSVAGD